MQRINVNLYPKDGYFFKEQDGVVIRGKKWTEVITKTVEYRIRAKLPAGDPAKEVIAQACTRNPSFCFQQTRVTVAPTVTLKARVIKWLNGLLKVPKEELEYVSPVVAKERSQICATCPQNQSLGVTGCSSCKQAFTEFRKQLLGGARIRDHRLGGCAILESDLVTAVHLDEVRVDIPSLPAHCWRKKII